MPKTILDVQDETPSASLTTRVASMVRSYVTGPFNLKDPGAARYFSAGGTTSAGVVVNEITAFMVAAMYDAVNQISSDVAKLPLNLLKRLDNGGSEHYIESNTYRLLKTEPNPEMGSMVFRRTLTAHALTCKGGFAEIERDGAGRPFALWLLTPDRVQPKRERQSDGTYTPLKYLIDGKKWLEPRDIIHLQGLGYDGAEAYPLVTFARQTLGLALASDQFSGSFYGNGATFGGVLTADGDTLDQDQVDAIQKNIEQQHKGADRAWKILVLGADFKYHQLGVNPRDAQLAELKDSLVEEVARFWNMPVHRLKVTKPGAASYASVEAFDLEYYKGCLLNWTTLWEEELNRKLISRLEYRRQFIKHNANAFLRGDIKSRYDALSLALDRGVINADEWRELEDMNPQENGQGKLYLVQGAMVPKDRLLDIVNAKIEKDKNASKPQPAAAPAGAANADALRAAIERADRAEQLARAAETAASEARERLATAEASLTTTREELAERRTEVIRATAFAEQLQLIEAFVRTKADAMQAAQAALEEQLRSRSAELAAAVQRAHDADARAIAAESERDRRVLEATAAGDLARDAERQATEASARVAALEGQLTAATTSHDEAVAAGVSAEEARAQAERAAAEARAVADDATARAVAFQTAADQATAAADNARADADARIAEANRAMDTALAEAAAARDTAADAEQRAQSAEAIATATRAEAEQQRAAANAQASEAAETIAALTASRVAAEADMATARTERDVARATATEAESRAAAAVAEAQAAAQRVTALTEELQRSADDRAAALTEERDAAIARATAAASDVTTTRQALEEATRRHTELEARVAASTEAYDALQRQLAEAHTAAGQLTERERALREQLAAAEERFEAERAAHGTALQDLQATVEAITEERRMAQFTATSLQEQLDVATRSLNAGVDALRQAREAEATALSAQITAHRQLMVDTMRRMIEREADRARGKAQTSDRFAAWIDSFYDGHDDYMQTALLPAMRIHLAFIRSTDDPIEETRRVVALHVADSQRQLRQLLDDDPIDLPARVHSVLHRWEHERVTALADRLMEKELAYARTA